ncbi:MAG TPA: type II toxin-antitoxin system PemK/MazF family toxin [Solirubrobacterales bacterium]
MNRGDIFWFDFDDVGRRPVLVLTRDEAIPVLRKITVAFVTRTVRGIPTEVRLDEKDGMPAECAVTLDNLRMVSTARLTEPIASLTGKRMHEVCRALAIATGCDWRPSRA